MATDTGAAAGGVPSILRPLADDLEARRAVDQHPETAAQQRLVVGDQDARHRVTTVSQGSRAKTRKPSPAGPAENSPS